VLADTGALFALLDDQDVWYARMQAWMSRSRDSLLVPMSVVQETAFLLGSRHGPADEAAFLRAAASEGMQLEVLQRDDLARAADLVDAYADFPLGFVDASIVAMAERLAIRDLLTTDRRHFSVVRPAHCERLRLLP
jgi:predicted nucleic acid-binding protein